MDWPYPNGIRRAWSPTEVGNSEVLAVPLLPKDKSLSRDQYLARLSDRIEWLVNQEESPQEAYELLCRKAQDSSDLRGIDPRRSNLGLQIVEAWEDLLRQWAGLNLVQFPVQVTPQSEAMEAIMETDLEGWLDYLIPRDHD